MSFYSRCLTKIEVFMFIYLYFYHISVRGVPVILVVNDFRFEREAIGERCEAYTIFEIGFDFPVPLP